MSALLPGFQDQLEHRAQQLDADARLATQVDTAVFTATGDDAIANPATHVDADAPQANALARPAARGTTRRGRRRFGSRRLHGRGLAVAVLVGVAGASGAAYAARGLWSPPLGNRISGSATATASALPPEQLKAFGVLRREQTTVDRGSASRFALTLNGKGAEIRTNDVRRLATGQNGGAVILVPFARQEGGLVAAMRAARGRLERGTELPTVVVRDQICLSYLSGYDGAGVACGQTDDLLRGKLTLGMSNPQCVSARQRKDFAEAQRRERAMAEEEGRPAVRMQCDRSLDAPSTTHVVGLVPDGVAAVKFSRSPNGVVVPVHGNVWQASQGSMLKVIWLDARGRELSKRLADTRARLGLPARP